MSGRYDVIIIGSGAGGGTLAHRLAPPGKRILILERGDWLPRESGELGCHRGFRGQRYVPAGTCYDKDGTTFQPQVHYNVGGATKLGPATEHAVEPPWRGTRRRGSRP